MTRHFTTKLLLVVLLFVSYTSLPIHAADTPQTAGASIPLRQGWQIQSSCETKAAGAGISTPGFNAASWTKTTVPSTVLAAQVAAGKFKNPYYDKNLLSIPGTDYPIGKIYANLPVTLDSPYRCSWWYRTDFTYPANWKNLVWLHFNGINYRANIWVNGQQIANSDQVAGAYRTYAFEISKYLKPGAKNAIAVETFIQTETDLGINFVDWNPAPADKSMGLWREVYLEQSGPITLRNPAVLTHFTDDQLSAAELTVIADVTNNTDQPQQGTVLGTIENLHFSQSISLNPRETKKVTFTPTDSSSLLVKNPKVWWPYQYGTPALHSLQLAIESAEGKTYDEKSIRFGIREVEGKLNSKDHLQIKINRKNILIRGAGWSPDMLYRESKERIETELQYVRDMHLNTVRLEGKLGSETIFNAADQMGILIMAGWCCCDHWEHWDKWAAKDHDIANASLYSQISRLRAHPSVYVWLNGSDNPPPSDVEKSYIAVLKERDWPNPFVSSASAKATDVTGKSGVKMSGPYDYVPPEYWYMDKDKYGGAYGYNTETGPGPAIPTIGSIKKTLPQSSWWPIDDAWKYHAGIGRFAQYDNFNKAMTASYGEPKNLEDYNRKAQWMAYDGERAMFEAYGANKYTSTGVIQWMLNNAWPSFIWHLYDYYLVPGGGYFGTKIANQPLHVQYNYDSRSVDVVNSTLAAADHLVVNAKVYDMQSKKLAEQNSTIRVDADGVVHAITLPAQNSATFVHLDLHNANGKLLSSNFYVVPAKLAELQWEKSTYFYTPASSYADLRVLEQLPKATVQAIAVPGADAQHGSVRLTNSGSIVAFFLHAQVLKPASEEEVAPVLWNDNFVSLLPGETRVLTYELPEYKSDTFTIKLDGWNTTPHNLTPAPANAKK